MAAIIKLFLISYLVYDYFFTQNNMVITILLRFEILKNVI